MAQKYKTVNGIRTHNPAYNPAYNPAAGAVPVPTAPFVNQATALPVVSTPTAAAVEEEEIAFVPTSGYEAAATQYHEVAEPEIYFGGYQSETGNGGDSLDDLNAVMAKYEVPAGMLAKLLELSQFDMAEIIVDDSGSMTLQTDAKDPTTGGTMTRWWEAKYRISQMVELMAYVPSPPINVYFLNRTDVLVLRRKEGELPLAYIARAENVLVKAFQGNPRGTTPALPAIQNSLNRNVGKKVLRYFIGDGVPDGRFVSIQNIQRLIVDRLDPQGNPFTFISCTNEDSEVEWMKTLEEKAPYCAEFDDYLDESREVLKDQGKAFPYSFGMHLVTQIVGAFNPHDLDAMDESIPFTKHTLDNLLGYQSSAEEYRYYFDSFVEAQRKLPLKRSQHAFVIKLPSLFEQFLEATVASEIPAAAQCKHEQRQPPAPVVIPPPRAQQHPPARPGCCLVL